jgi:hypothetical protein
MIMASTTFSGPVTSLNGFIGGTSAVPIAVTTAGNINSSYATTSAATGDTRLSYNKLTFTSTGSGETIRAFSVVTGVAAATGGTINGAHISLSIDAPGTISGSAHALRATLGMGALAAPGGTLSALNVDSDLAANCTVPASAAFIRVTNSGTKVLANMMAVPSPAVAGAFRAAVGSPVVTHTMPVLSANGTTYYIMCSTVA